MMMQFFSTIIVFTAAIASVAAMRQMSILFRWVDRPDAVRKQHRGPIPLCGGLAVFGCFAAVAFLAGQFDRLEPTFWLALMLVTIVGAVDDRWPLPAGARLIVQLGVATALVLDSDIGSLALGTLFATGTALLFPLFLVIGIGFVTGMINAWNMLDGVDGLAGGVAATAIVWLIIFADVFDLQSPVPLLKILLICLCAFLVFNMRSPWRARASVFLGDAGSTALGATIAYVILLLATGSGVPFPALLWVVILPVMDTLSLIVRRILAHRSPMSADRWHLHHLLLDLGLSPSATTSVLIVTSALCGAVGFAGATAGASPELMAIGLIVPMGLHSLFVMAVTGTLSRLGLAHLRQRSAKRRLVVRPGSGSGTPAFGTFGKDGLDS